MSSKTCSWCPNVLRVNAQPFGNDTFLLCDSCMELRLQNEMFFHPEPGSREDLFNRLDQADYEDYLAEKEEAQESQRVTAYYIDDDDDEDEEDEDDESEDEYDGSHNSRSDTSDAAWEEFRRRQGM